jgi:UV DNA damage repair endonuclease
MSVPTLLDSIAKTCFPEKCNKGRRKKKVHFNLAERVKMRKLNYKFGIPLFPLPSSLFPLPSLCWNRFF